MSWMGRAMLALAVVLGSGSAQGRSPAQARIEAARVRTEAPGAPSVAWKALAGALLQRARESGDSGFYLEALDALGHAIAVDPADAEIPKIAVWARLGLHEFSEAAAIARAYLAARPDDAEALGLLGDALMELGRYDEARAAYQRMMDLRPGPGAYLRASYWREVSGDLPGAIEVLERAQLATDPRETEARAWIRVLLGKLLEQREDFEAADEQYARALELFPDYHYALAARARLALLRDRPEQARALAERAIEVAPHAERYLILADALRALGDEAAARQAEERFESLALAHRSKADNENRHLVDFYLDRRPDPERALALAREEAAVRQDVATLDRLARALHRTGAVEQAREVMARVLAVGTRDARILRHAAQLGVAPPPPSDPPRE